MWWAVKLGRNDPTTPTVFLLVPRQTETPPSEMPSPLQLGMISDYAKDFQPGLDLLQVLCHTREDLSPSAFAQAWNVVVNRHDLLRSRFLWQEVDVPVREVQGATAVPFQEHDWRGLSAKEQDAQFETFLAEDRRAGVDLAVAPLMRVTLFRTGRKRWRWCWTHHHLLLDTRGILLVLDEVFAIYEALRSGREKKLPPAPAFSDYVAWHLKQDWSAAETWWRAHLAGFTRPTPLLADHAPGRGSGDAWAEYKVELSSRVTRRLGALASQAGVTLNTVLQAAWGLFLGRCSGEQEVVFGATRACRKSSISSAPAIAGLFVNTLPVRVRLDPESGLIPWLREIRRQWMEIRCFENVPLSDVQGWSAVPRGSRLFESIFNYQEPSWDKALSARGGAWRRRDFCLRSQPGYPLTLNAYGGGSSLVLDMVYDRRRFSEDTVSRMMEYLQTLLESMAASGARRLGNLEMFSGAARRQVVKKWNETARRYPRKGLHELFEQQAKRTPDAVAATFGGESITYHKLNLRANRLGRYLRAQGAGQGGMVAICAERSLDLIVGLLGILKAGAAYVPLDPAYPGERLVFMLQDTGAPLLLTQSNLAPQLPSSGVRTILLDTDWPVIKRESSDGFSSGTDAQSPAYVIYTSGSTGKPKGVVVPHGAVVRLVVNTDYVRLSSSEVLLQVAPVSFDASTFEIWGALLNGARIAIHPPGRFSLEELAEFIASRQVTTMFITTALFEQLVELYSESLSGVRQLLTGGETMPVETMRKALRNLPNTRIIHCYGPTENTTFTTCFAVDALAPGATSVPIGRPIANTTVYILDARLQPVPPGVPGDLYTGGAGLALGYLNQPELTAERFIPHPFGRRNADRLYRTGDVARWLPDGTVDFIGRRDHQVKIRGHRIELGEIESVLCSHPQMRDAVVVAREDSPGNKRLIAFMSLRGRLPIREVRRFLEGRLPAYMVPSVFVALDSFPLNANGKVDRHALIDTHWKGEAGPDGGDGDGRDASRRRVAPRTETEEMVAAIWSEALEVQSVGVHDHFFELGGHSLRAMTVVSKLRKALGKSVPVRLLFEKPVLESFCSALEKLRLGDLAENEQTIIAMPRMDPLPASSFQERIWSNHVLRKEGAPNNHALHFLLKGMLDVPALERSLSDIVRRHEVLRTRVKIQEGCGVQHIAPAGPMTLEVVPMEGVLKRTDAFIHQVEKIGQTSLEEGSGPMIRFVLLRWSPVSHFLIVVLHPLTYDASVRRILFRELEILYASYREGGQPDLPPPGLQYADFAMWQRRWLQGESPARRKMTDFWIQTLAGELHPVALPFAKKTPRPGSPAESFFPVFFPRDTVSRLALTAREHGATQFMFLLACVKILLCLRTGQTDILVGTYFAGQSRPELDDVMGPKANLTPLRTDLSGNPAFSEILKRVREVVLEAQAHQDLPFEWICATMQAVGGSPPTIEAIFMHTHLERPLVRLAGVRCSSSRVFTRSMPWGFTLNFVSRDDGRDSLQCGCGFDGNRYEPAEVRKVMGALPELLHKVTVNPSLRLDELGRAG